MGMRLELTEQDAELDILGFAKTLRRAAELVEQGWCQGTSAIDLSGYAVSLYDSDAVRFCEMGAVFRARHELGLPHLPVGPDFSLLLALAGYPLDGFGGAYNDIPGRTAEEVAAHLRKGADTLEQVWHRE